MSKTIYVLDHGAVALKDSMGNDASIVEAARVSHDEDDLAGADPLRDKNLIRYLMDNRHTSPFEMVEFKFYVKAPIFIFRQWHRHRTWNYNEVSARYTQLPDEMFIPELESIGLQSTSNKQARTLGDLEPERRAELEKSLLLYSDTIQRSYSTYAILLHTYKWPRELARCVLPFAIYSKMYAKVDLHNLFHFLGLRLHEHTQKETRVYAEAMAEFVKPVVPEAWACFERVLRHNAEFRAYLAKRRKEEKERNAE